MLIKFYSNVREVGEKSGELTGVGYRQETKELLHMVS